MDLLGELGRRANAYASYVSALGRLRAELTEHLLHGSVEHCDGLLPPISLRVSSPCRP